MASPAPVRAPAVLAKEAIRPPHGVNGIIMAVRRVASTILKVLAATSGVVQMKRLHLALLIVVRLLPAIVMALVKLAKALDLVRRIVNLPAVRLVLLLSTTITRIPTPATTRPVRAAALMMVPAVRQVVIRAVPLVPSVPQPSTIITLLRLIVIIVSAPMAVVMTVPAVRQVVIRAVPQARAIVMALAKALNHIALVLLIVEVLLQVQAPDLAVMEVAAAERPLPAVRQTVAVALARVVPLLSVMTARAV